MKLFLAADAYTLRGQDGYSTQMYYVSEGKLRVLKMDEKYLELINIENFVGSGESVDYDLIKVEKQLEIIAIRESKDGDNRKVEISVESSSDLSEIEKMVKEYFKHTNNCVYEFKKEFITYSTLEELNDSIEDNDFAKPLLTQMIKESKCKK